MSIDSNYIPAFSIEDVLLDKDTGAPLAGGLVYFEQDNNPGVLKPVFQITGSSPNYTYTPLPNPMILSSIGTFEDSLGNPVVPYFFPYDASFNPEYYYVRVESAGGITQFDRVAVPFIPISNTVAQGSSYENELANPQFSEVLFDTTSSTYVYNFGTAVSKQAVSIAPNWEIVVSSGAACSVTVSQSKPIGSVNIITNPGTLLTISSANVTSLRLRQRLYGSPNVWSNNYVSGSFVAKTYGGTSSIVTMYYSQSNGTVTDQIITSGTLDGNGNYAAHPGSLLIPESTSGQNYPNAYVDIELDLPLGVQIDITSIMVACTGTVSQDAIVYSQDTQDRQIDHLFHYYKPQLDFKPIPSLLTGWDFPLNPAQMDGGTTQTMNKQATTPKYLWDQTIGASLYNNVNIVRNSVTGGIQATTGVDGEVFYYLQYLSGQEVKELLGNKLAVNIDAFQTQAGIGVTAQVYLFAGGSTASFPTLPTSLGTVAANGVFSLTAANWNPIPRGNLGTASGSLSIVNTVDYTTLNDRVDLNFNGWELNTSATISDTDKFAIVVTFLCPTIGTVVTVNSVSLNKGDIATRPAAKTKEATLIDCSYYYEKSYNEGQSAAPTIYAGQLSRPMIFVSPAVYAKTFSFDYYPKITTPSISIYSPLTGTANNIDIEILYNNTNPARTGGIATANPGAVPFGTYFAFESIGYKHSVIKSTDNTTVLLTIGGATGREDAFAKFHFIADARLGVV